MINLIKNRTIKKYMSRLEIIKALADLERIKEELPEAALSKKYIEMALSRIEDESGLCLSHKDTTPKKLWGKTYRDLTKDEVREYTQIKRIITRRNKGDKN